MRFHPFPLRGRVRLALLPWLLLILAGLLITTLSVMGLNRDQSTPGQFTVAIVASTFGADTPHATPSSPPSTRPSSATPTTAPTPATRATPATPARTASTGGRALFGLRLPTLHVTANAHEVVTTHGVLQVPDNPLDVGWWTGSPLPGSAQGATIIDGHIDSARTGPGALAHVAQLRPADPIEVVLPNGHILTYLVTARRVFVKSAGLPPSLFTAAGPPHLTVISCGGPFDSNSRSYEDNIVTLATPTTH